MKKTLLALTITALFGLKVSAQEPYTLNLFDEAIFYNMYEGTVDEPLPANAIRLNNSSYARKITEEQIASLGNTLALNIILSPRCDDFDRIGKLNLAFVPKNSTSYSYNNVTRIEIGRFITPFMSPAVPDATTPYSFQVDNIVQVLKDVTLSAEYDFWIEFEVYGYQGSPTQGGAVADYPAICTGRNDVYAGSLELVSTNNPSIELGENHFTPIINNFELKDYTLDGTDVLNETVKSITFTLEEDFPDAKLYLITSNHGSAPGGEEYVRRNHFIYFDGDQVFMYKPGGKSCEPYREYNTQGPNGIYGANPMSALQWASFSNWCPGDVIPIRVIELGDVTAGEHTFKINVPDAEFQNTTTGGDDGYFPMSVYIQGYDVTLGSESFTKKAFTVSPNPVNDIATITTNGQDIKTVSVVNILGQAVLTGTTERVDLSSLQSGIYMVRVDFTNNTSAVQKIVKK